MIQGCNAVADALFGSQIFPKALSLSLKIDSSESFEEIDGLFLECLSQILVGFVESSCESARFVRFLVFRLSYLCMLEVRSFPSVGCDGAVLCWFGTGCWAMSWC